MQEQKLIYSTDGVSLKEFLPQDDRIDFIYLGVGYAAYSYSYNESITTDLAGRVSGGGTKHDSYNAFDFGFGVMNLSDEKMRVEFDISKIDNEGYSLEDMCIKIDVTPGEKRRAWSGLHVTKVADFYMYRVTEIRVGPSQGYSEEEDAVSAVSSPQISIHELLDLPKPRVKLILSLAVYAGAAAALYGFYRFMVS